MKVEWRLQARIELAAILNYIISKSPSGAARVRAQILHSVTLLEEWPDIGRIGRRGRRELVIPHAPYVVIYKRLPTHIEIMRVLHTSRQR